MAHPVRSRGFPLNCLYYSTSCPGCQALFWTFFIFFGSAPSIRAEVVRRHPTACAALCLLFITRVMGRPFKHHYQGRDFVGLTAHCCDLPPTHLRREALFTPRVCGVFLPLCDFSISQPLDFVKHFFIFFAPALRLPHLGAGALRPSCRPLRSSFQTPADAGSHLYPAQQDSVRSRTLSSRTYRLSWVLHPSPLRTFGLCLASLIYILIIPQVLRFVKHFF